MPRRAKPVAEPQCHEYSKEVLRDMAHQQSVPGRWKMTKGELCQALGIPGPATRVKGESKQDAVIRMKNGCECVCPAGAKPTGTNKKESGKKKAVAKLTGKKKAVAKPKTKASKATPTYVISPKPKSSNPEVSEDGDDEYTPFPVSEANIPDTEDIRTPEPPILAQPSPIPSIKSTSNLVEMFSTLQDGDKKEILMPDGVDETSILQALYDTVVKHRRGGSIWRTLLVNGVYSKAAAMLNNQVFTLTQAKGVVIAPQMLRLKQQVGRILSNIQVKSIQSTDEILPKLQMYFSHRMFLVNDDESSQLNDNTTLILSSNPPTPAMQLYPEVFELPYSMLQSFQKSDPVVDLSPTWNDLANAGVRMVPTDERVNVKVLESLASLPVMVSRPDSFVCVDARSTPSSKVPYILLRRNKDRKQVVFHGSLITIVFVVPADASIKEPGLQYAMQLIGENLTLLQG